MTDTAAGSNPFPGLRPFEADERFLFFGRDEQVDELLNRLRKRRLIAVVGASGSGKSSFVLAGMLPALQAGSMLGAGAGWFVCRLEPGGGPVANLARALADAGVACADVEDRDLRRRLTQAVLERGPTGIVELVRRRGLEADQNVLVLVDQFEELFRFAGTTATERQSDEAAAFVDLLLQAACAADLPLYVVLTMRSDFLGDCARFRDLPETLNDGLFLVPRMTRDQLRQAIEGPVGVAGATIEPALATRLLNELGDDRDRLPVLQHALMRTYQFWLDDRAPNDPIGAREYERTGGLSAALSNHGDAVYAALPDARSRDVATRLFKALTDKGGDNRGIRRPTRVRDAVAITGASRDELLAVAAPFRAASCSFLRPAAGRDVTDETFLDISHESLMRLWGDLRTWVDEEADSAQRYRRLAEAAELYEHGEAAFWRDEDLASAMKWREDPKTRPTAAWARRLVPAGEIRDDERFERAMRFLDLSEDAQRAALQAKRSQEEAQRRRRLEQLVARRTRVAAIATAALAVVALVLAGVAYRQQQQLAAALQTLQTTDKQLSITQRELGFSKRAVQGQLVATSENILPFEVDADPLTLNPLFAHADPASVEQQLAHLSFEPFFDLDPHGRPVPELLSSIPTAGNGISPDGRTIVYHLRHGLRWSDGVALTSHDVLFTLAAIEDKTNRVASREGYDLIDRAEAPDAYTVRLHLTRAWAPAVSTFFTYGSAPQYVLPAHVFETKAATLASFSRRPLVGDGPYSFVSWNPGDRLIYRANPKYWRGTKLGGLDIAIDPYPDSNLTLLRDVAFGFNLVAPVQLPALRQHPELGFVQAAAHTVVGIALNLRHAPLDDVRVRRAIAMSIDRAAISSSITSGYYPVADSDRPRDSWAYDPSVKLPPYDPAAADRLLDAAGWRRGAGGRRSKAGKPLALTYVQFKESQTGLLVAAYAQQRLARRGIALTIRQTTVDQLSAPKTGVLAAGDFDMAYETWEMGADPDDEFLVGCDGAANFMHYCDSQVEQLERAAVGDASQATRKLDYGRIDRLVAQDVPIVYLFDAAYVYAYNKKLSGFAPNGFLPTWNAYAWSFKN